MIVNEGHSFALERQPMKKMILSSLVILSSLTVSAARSAGEYQCIMDSLEAYNSSIYYGIDSQDIEKILAEQADGRYYKVSEVADDCELKALTSKKICGSELEAKFAGQVKDASEVSDGSFEPTRWNYRIGNFSTYNMNAGCMLPQKFAEKALLQTSAQISNGQEISGVLIYNADSKTYRIEVKK